MNNNLVLIAEDHPLIINGLKHVIGSLNAALSIEVTETCKEFGTLLESLDPAYCIVDLHLSDGLALEAIENAINNNPQISILVYTTLSEDLYASRLVNIGVRGFLNKTSSEKDLVECLSKFFNDEFYIGPEFLAEIDGGSGSTNSQTENPFHLLSNRELVIVQYILQGMRIKEICFLMNLKASTVATFKARAFQKLNVASNFQLLSLFETHKKV